MKLGFIGAGFIARFHAIAIHQVRGLEVAGLLGDRGVGYSKNPAEDFATGGQRPRTAVAVITKAQHNSFPVLRAGTAPARVLVAECANFMRHRSFARRGLFLVTALIASALLAAVPAGAGQWLQGKFTGEEMLAHCKAAEKDPMQDFGRGICTGFIDGFTAGHFVAETWHGFHHRDEKMDDIFGHLCVPDGTTRGHLARVFVQFLERNPEKLKLPAGLLLEDALRESFLCPK